VKRAQGIQGSLERVLLESPGFFFFKIPGPGKSWKITLLLEKFMAAAPPRAEM